MYNFNPYNIVLYLCCLTVFVLQGQEIRVMPVFTPPQVLAGGCHALQQRRASLFCGVPDRRLLDALRRPAQRQPGASEQTSRAPAAVLARVHQEHRDMSTRRRSLQSSCCCPRSCTSGAQRHEHTPMLPPELLLLSSLVYIRSTET